MKYLLLMLVTASLFSCSSVSKRTTAIHDTLVTDAAMHQAALNCSAYGGDERRIAQQERVNWWRRNSNYVLAADYGLLQLTWDDAPQPAETQRAVLSMQLLENIQTDADILLAEWFGRYEEPEDCIKLFERVEKGRLDISRDKNQAGILSEIYAQRVSVEGDAETARSINTRYRKYGRSLFVVEDLLRQEGCQSPTVSMLRNSWPLEVYDAACNTNTYVIVQCNWGRCELKR